jgi:2-polyprenyl-3-methyl-5-hydroxy-6-metoxy-1,4-benzoquinol methylase
LRIIQQNKIDLQLLKHNIDRPQLYEKGTSEFWNDEYISAQMLKLHLKPEVESASRTTTTIKTESAFIIAQTGINEAKVVLDLGCGPGLYVEEFAKTGAQVTGVDLSARSINYATKHVSPAYRNAAFVQMNYLDLTFSGLFDVVTLIFYDFCVLKPEEQRRLLLNINSALKTGGVLVFDVISENFPVEEATSIKISEGNGFWSPNPYLEISSTFKYEKPKTMGQQYTIIAEDGEINVTKLYTRLFSITELSNLLTDCGFKVEKIYKNLKGDPVTEDSQTYGVFAKKSL